MDLDARNIFFMSTFLILLLTMNLNCSAAYPIAMPDCPDRCGSESIPYPFGIGERCALTPEFALQCLNDSSGQPKPCLPSDDPDVVGLAAGLDVTDISLEGQLRAYPYVGYDCRDTVHNHTHSDHDRAGPEMRLSYVLAFNDTLNKLTAIGCNTYALATGTKDEGSVYTTGCISICDRVEDVEDGECSGVGCCQTSIPNGAWEINVTMGRFDSHIHSSKFNLCNYGFVVEAAAFKFFAGNLTNIRTTSRLPVVLDWVAEYGVTCQEARNNATSYACKSKDSKCYYPKGATGYRCRCNDGFEGNPYLQADGCRDVKECANSSLHKCAKHSDCVDTEGSYICKCKHGYHGDGRKDGDGCSIKLKMIYFWPVIGASTGSVFLLAFTLCFYFQRMRRKTLRLREEFFRKNGGLLLQQKLIGKGDNHYATRIFTAKELQAATNNFDENHIVGEGGFGIVFKGELTDNKKVAIKRPRAVDPHQIEQFINEVILLSQINNRNVVKLLGCCLETQVPLLVYEFIANGTLSEHLHHKVEASKLTWNLRLRIATDVAGVLSYLHSVAFPPIIHRDIKSANILLDQNYTAKVSDFGISRLLPTDDDQVLTMVQGTHGYLDPEYLQTGVLTEKSDVYSFGVVLMELMTGKKVLAADRPEAERFLSNYFLSALQNDHLSEVFDASISRDENMEQLKEAAMIAKKCTSVKGEDRPYMKDIARELEALAVNTQQILAQALDVDFEENEGLLGTELQEFENGPTSMDLCIVCLTITEQMLLPIAGGR